VPQAQEGEFSLQMFGRGSIEKPASAAADPIEAMGRMQMRQKLKEAGVDYRDARNDDELRALLAALLRGTGKGWPPTGAAKAPAEKSPVMDVNSMPRGELIKMLRERNIEYRNAHNIAELRDLARQASQPL